MTIWTDELGYKVEVLPFFSRLYIDEEMRKLNKRFSFIHYESKQVPSSLESAESEHVALKILSLAKANQGWGGIAEEELRTFLERFPIEIWTIPDLIWQGYLRRKMVAGVAVLFPTEELFLNQKTPELNL